VSNRALLSPIYLHLGNSFENYDCDHVRYRSIHRGVLPLCASFFCRSVHFGPFKTFILNLTRPHVYTQTHSRPALAICLSISFMILSVGRVGSFDLFFQPSSASPCLHSIAFSVPSCSYRPFILLPIAVKTVFQWNFPGRRHSSTDWRLVAKHVYLPLPNAPVARYMSLFSDFCCVDLYMPLLPWATTCTGYESERGI